MITALGIAMIVLFLHATTWDGHIFSGIKKIIPPDDSGHKWYKAIYGCSICMTPWWGSLIYWIVYWNCNTSIRGWLWCVGVAAGINVLNVCLLTVRKYCVTATKKIEDETSN